MSCGSCPAWQVCNNNVCCRPKTCADASATCGQISDGCGGTVTCGSCPAGKVCSGNACVTLPTVQPQLCSVTCNPGEDLVCGDIDGCNLFCYSSSSAPDPDCPAVGCGDSKCTGQVTIQYSTVSTSPAQPAFNPYQGSCAPGYVDCSLAGWSSGCEPGTQPDLQHLLLRFLPGIAVANCARSRIRAPGFSGVALVRRTPRLVRTEELRSMERLATNATAIGIQRPASAIDQPAPTAFH